MTYTIQKYDSRNTAFDLMYLNNAQMARIVAIKESKASQWPVKVQRGTFPNIAFEMYEQGEKTEWSFEPL